MTTTPETRLAGPTARGGFSLIDLLVTIVVISFLIGLISPVVLSDREKLRRQQCANNMKQLGLALHEYHTSYGIFPPSSVWRSPKDWATLDIEQTAVGNNPNLAENWVVLILPQLEQITLYKSFDRDKPTPDAANKAARGTKLPVMLCPSDTFNRKAFNGSASKLTDKLGDDWGRGNYGANASLGFMTAAAAPAPNGADPVTWRNRYICGVMGANISCRIDDIKDGTSNTILLGELRAGMIPQDPRGVWALGNASGSALWAHGYAGDDNGPNCGSLRADGPCSCSEVWAAVGGGPELVKAGMSCDDANHPNWQQTARSTHDGDGVNVCMADGSVRFISDKIQLGTKGPMPASLGVWDKLNLSNDGMPVDPKSY